MATTKPRKYAQGSSVPIDKSEGEIKRRLKLHGATGFLSGEHDNQAGIVFELAGRRYRITVSYPDVADYAYADVNQFASRPRTPSAQQDAWEREKARLWRAMVLYITAKIEAVESRITTIEQAFRDETVLPDGSTLGEFIEPQIQEAYRDGSMPQLLPWRKSLPPPDHKMLIDNR